MENQPATNSKSKWGKISLICGLTTILLGFLGATVGYFLKSKELALVFLLFSILLLLTGIISGAIGLFTKRAWIGLVINLLLAAIIFALMFVSYFMLCCPKPDPI